MNSEAHVIPAFRCSRRCCVHFYCIFFHPHKIVKSHAFKEGYVDLGIEGDGDNKGDKPGEEAVSEQFGGSVFCIMVFRIIGQEITFGEYRKGGRRTVCNPQNNQNSSNNQNNQNSSNNQNSPKHSMHNITKQTILHNIGV